MECPNCQSDVAGDVAFCSHCGNEMARRHDERRVVTVLFADIVGFTGLSEARDPEQVKNLVDRCFALLADDITAFGGRVDKVVGDAIIAMFGAPVAHEDDAERAVRAALRMQETVERYDRDSDVSVQVRIGINTGEVLVGAIAAGDDYTAMGDVVNTASRLQTAADPGTVIVGPITHAATAEVIHYRSVGQLHARGREEPVPGWRAIEPVGQPGERRSEPTTELVGRGPELDLLGRAVAAAYHRSRGQLISLAGESGVGKSRLAAEVADVAHRDHDAVVLHGRCLPYGEENVWWPVAEAIRDAVGLSSDAESDEVTERVRRAVTKAFPENAPETEISRTTEGLRHLLGYESSLQRLEPEKAGDEAARAIRTTLQALSRRSPVLLWLSDIDWADGAVLNLVDDLLDRLSRQRVVVMVTGRVEMFDRWTPSPGRFNSVTLSIDPLPDREAQRLARELLPAASDAVLDEVVSRAGGNPLFLEEMARMVLSSDDAAVKHLPANVRSVIGARLDALDQDALHVVEDAAVLGHRGHDMALQRMAEFERNQSDIGDALRVLERADLFEVVGPLWSFRSNVVRDVVYDRLTKTDRAFRHAGIAEWIATHKAEWVASTNMGAGAETIAYHYRRSAVLARDLGGVDGLPHDLEEQAIRWTLDAARRKSRVAGIDRGSSLFRDALELMAPDDDRRASVLLERAARAMKVLHIPTVRDDVEAARPLVLAGGDLELGVRLALLESELDQWSGDHSSALERAEDALVIAGELGESSLQADALRRAGMVHLFSGAHALAETSINAAHDAYVEAEDQLGMAWARQNLAWIAYVSGEMVEAERRLAQAADAFEALGDRSGIMWSRGLLAWVRIHDGRFAEAEELARQTLVEVEERGDTWGQGMMNVAIATAALWTGQVEEAIRRATVARSLFRDSSDPVGLTQAIATEGRALIRSGRVAEGFRVINEALAAGPQELARGALENSLMAAAASVGDIDQGREFFGEISGFDPNVLGESDRAVANALINLQMGQPAEAKRLLDVMPDTETGTGSIWGWSVLALVAAVTNEDVEKFAGIVEAAPRATYTDRVLARCATACAAARVGDEAATRVAIQRAKDAVPAAGDRLYPTIIAIAEAQCLAALSADDVGAVEARAAKGAAAMGIDDTGWRIVFGMATGSAAG